MFVSSQNYFFSVKDVGAAVRRERIFSLGPFNWTSAHYKEGLSRWGCLLRKVSLLREAREEVEERGCC